MWFRRGLTWYLVSSVLQTPVNNIKLTSNGMSALVVILTDVEDCARVLVILESTVGRSRVSTMDVP